MAQQSQIEISKFYGGIAKVTVNGKWVGNLYRNRSQDRTWLGQINPMRSYFAHVNARGARVGDGVRLGDDLTARETRANCIAYLRSL